MAISAAQRFDDSFSIHMIRDFFLVLLGVILIELGIRFALVIYDFNTKQKVVTQRTAERLATDVQTIMLNRGGAVAARTVYPILRRNHDRLGFSVAIQPSAITIESIQSIFSFTPQGILPVWPEGRHQEARVDIAAEQFCVQCHVTAKPGDILGEVTVRSYLDRQLQDWWHEVKLTGTLGMLKILLHTIVLFLLLKIRMEPLVSLQAVITLLAKAGSDLSHRAPIKSKDEFGELARDLNLFLDRLCQIVEDLGGVLTHITGINKRLITVHDQMGGHYRDVDSKTLEIVTRAHTGARINPVLSEEWLSSVEGLLVSLEKIEQTDGVTMEQSEAIRKLVSPLKYLAKGAGEAFELQTRVGLDLTGLSTRVRDFSRWLEEMAVLEEKMRTISEQGQTLLQRLTEQKGDDE